MDAGMMARKEAMKKYNVPERGFRRAGRDLARIGGAAGCVAMM
jgi:hypothetical protein